MSAIPGNDDAIPTEPERGVSWLQPTLPGMEHLAPAPAEERVHQHEGHEHHQHDDEGYAIPQAPPVKEVETAFLVFLNDDGVWIAESNLDTPIKPRRIATLRDMRRAAAEVIHDVNTLLITENVINAQMQVARQAAEQAQTQMLADRLNMGRPGGGQGPFPRR